MKTPQTQQERYNVFCQCVSWTCANWNMARILLNERDTGFKGDYYATRQFEINLRKQAEAKTSVNEHSAKLSDSMSVLDTLSSNRNVPSLS